MDVMNLKWEDAQHDDEPRDLIADTALVEHGYWSLGPDVNGWRLDLIELADDLTDDGGGMAVGHFRTSAEAKAVAQAAEDRGHVS